MNKSVMLKSGKQLIGDEETLADFLKVQDLATSDDAATIVDAINAVIQEALEFTFDVYPLSIGSRTVFIPRENIDYIAIDGAIDFINEVSDFAAKKGWV